MDSHIHIVRAVWQGRLVLSAAVMLIATLLLVTFWKPAHGPVETSQTTPLVRMPKANLVLIVIDTLRADALGAYGHEQQASPELDLLASRGVRFQNALSQSSWTRPSFASFLTSQWPRSMGITQESQHGLPESATTLAEVLSSAGYTTLGVTANPNINATFRFDQGFTAYISSGVRFSWMKEEALPSDKDHKTTPLKTAPEVFREASELLDRHQTSGKPIFLQLDLMEVHERKAGPLQTELRRRYAQHPDAAYLASLRYLSSEIEAFLDSLRQRPGFSNTLVVLTSDHGEGLRSHPHVQGGAVHGYVAYESQTRVPLILGELQPTQLPKGLVVEQPVRMLDLMPTVLELLNVPAPKDIAGVSLGPLLAGRPLDLPRPFVVETHFRGTHAIAVYDSQFAYVENRTGLQGTLPEELQRLGSEQDGALTDQSPHFPDEVRRLKAMLHHWEKQHPVAAPALLGQREVSAEEREQLKALGYID